MTHSVDVVALLMLPQYIRVRGVFPMSVVDASRVLKQNAKPRAPNEIPAVGADENDAFCGYNGVV
jgi:hypothetical protein